MEAQGGALEGGLRWIGVAFGAAFGTAFVVGLTLFMFITTPFFVLLSNSIWAMAPIVILIVVPVMSILTSLAITRAIERSGPGVLTIGGALGAVSGFVSLIAFGLVAPWFDLPWFDISRSLLQGLFLLGVPAAITGIPIGVFVAMVLTRLSGSPGRHLRWVSVLGLLLGFPLGYLAPAIIFIVGYVMAILIAPLLR